MIVNEVESQVELLLQACTDGDLGKVKDIVKNDPNILSNTRGDLEVVQDCCLENAKDSIRIRATLTNQCTPFLAAAKAGHVNILQYLLDKDKNFLNDSTNYKENALHLSAYEGHIDVVKFLIKNDPMMYKKNWDGFTPALCASLGGHLPVLKFFLTLNKDILNDRTNKGNTPFLLAALGGHIELLEFLINTNPKYLLDTNEHKNCGLYICIVGQYVDAARFLLKQAIKIYYFNDNLDPSFKDKISGQLKLMQNCCDRSEDLERNLKESIFLLKPIDPNINNKELSDRFLLMHRACLSNNLLNIDDLSKEGVSINAKDSFNFVPLHTAIWLNQYDAVDKLLKLGASIYEKDYQDKTPLHLAVDSGSQELVDLLIQQALSEKDKQKVTQLIKSADKKGNTLLSIAVASHKSNNPLEIIKILFDNYKAEMLDLLKEKNYKNYTPIQIAVITNKVEVVKYFLNINQINLIDGLDEQQNSLLQLAIIYNSNFDIINLLVELNVNLKHENNQGKSAEQLTVEIHSDMKEHYRKATENAQSKTIRNNFSKLHDTLLKGSIDKYKTEMEKCILVDKACLNYTDEQENTLIHIAIKSGSIEMINFWIDKGVDKNRCNNQCETVLDFSISIGNKMIVEHLFNKAQELILFSKPIQRSNILHHAYSLGKMEIFKWLTQQKQCEALLLKHDINNHTVLHLILAKDDEATLSNIFSNNLSTNITSFIYDLLYFAIKSNAEKCSILLIKKIENVDENINGKTLLGLLLDENLSANPLVIERIINRGCRLDRLNDKHENAFHLITQLKENKLPIANLVRASKNYSTDLFEEKNKDGFSPLHIAVQNKDMQMLNLIMDTCKDNIKALNQNSGKSSCKDTPLHLAVRTGNPDIINILCNSRHVSLWKKNLDNKIAKSLGKELYKSEKISYSANKIIKQKTLQNFQVMLFNDLIKNNLKTYMSNEIKKEDEIRNIISTIEKILLAEQEVISFLKSILKNYDTTNISINKIVQSIAKDASQGICSLMKAKMIKTVNGIRENELEISSNFKRSLENTKLFLSESVDFNKSLSTPYLLHFNQDNVRSLKEKAFKRALKESLRYMYYVNLALIHKEVNPPPDKFNNAIKIFETISPSIAGFMPSVNIIPGIPINSDLIISFVNGFLNVIKDIKDKQAIECALNVVDAFGSPGWNGVNVDLIKAIADLFYERFKNQIYLMSISFNTTGKLRLHDNDGIVKFANVIAGRINEHILSGRDAKLNGNESSIALVRGVSSAFNKLGKLLQRQLTQIQNIKPEENTPVIIRCLLASWNQLYGYNVEIELDVKDDRNIIIKWPAQYILCFSGIRLLNNPDCCFIREGYNIKEIGCCFGTEAEANLRQYERKVSNEQDLMPLPTSKEQGQYSLESSKKLGAP
jgi:ankyrin repeat protein